MYKNEDMSYITELSHVTKNAWKKQTNKNTKEK